jgi:penicillin-binding protein 2
LKLKQRQRLLILCFSSLIIFGLLVGRLAYLQLAKGNALAREAVRQRAQTVTLDYNRGDILDKNGVSLLGGEREKVLVLFPGLLAKNDPQALETVFSLVPVSSLSGQPAIALRKLSDQEEAQFTALQCSGLVVAEAQKRYGLQALATHVVGHVGPEDGKGKVGLELVFDESLQGGTPNVLAAVVDGRNDLVEGIGLRLWGESASSRPYSLVLTIDNIIQRKVEEIMDERVERGAVIVINPRNGDILAMASRPNYFQASLTDYLQDTDAWINFLETQPFINRGILSYPPGSIFKIVVAAAALEAGNYSLDSSFYCPGSLQIGDQLFHCYQNKAHGHITLAQAFAHSCNTVFIELAMELGRQTISDYAARLGLGQVCGLPLGNSAQGGEAAGHIPLPQELPYLGDLALAAIGQGSVETTPLQIARLTAAIANGGYLIEPRLARAMQTPEGTVVRGFPEGKKVRVLNPLTAAKIRLMMRGVVEYGTGKAAYGERLLLGGKSGTAETGRVLNGVPQHYSWFSGFWARGENKAVITVFIEKPIRGSAAELFGALAEAIEPELAGTTFFP